MTTLKEDSSRNTVKLQTSQELTISFQGNDSFTGILHCKLSPSQDDCDEHCKLPTNLLLEKIVPLSEMRAKTSYYNTIQPLERSNGTLDWTTIILILNTLKAGLLLRGTNDEPERFFCTPKSSKLVTLSIISTDTTRTKKRMMNAKTAASNKKSKSKGVPVEDGNTKQMPLELSHMTWLHAIPSDRTQYPMPLSDLNTLLRTALETGTPTPATFATQILPQALLVGNVHPKCVTEIQLNKRVLHEFLSNNVLLDQKCMYELVSNKSAANTACLLRQIQMQALLRLQLYCMAPDMRWDTTQRSSKSKSKCQRGLTRRNDSTVLPKDKLISQVTTAMSFSSFLLDSSQPFDVFLKGTIPPSIYYSAPDVVTELFDYFEVVNPFLTTATVPDAVVLTPTPERKAEPVKFVDGNLDFSHTQILSAKSKERQVGKEQNKGKANTLATAQINDGGNVGIQLGDVNQESELLSTSSTNEIQNVRNERRKSGKGQSLRTPGEGLLTQTSCDSSNPFSSCLALTRASLLSTKKKTLVKDATSKYVGSHFNDNVARHYVLSNINKPIDRPCRKEVVKSQSLAKAATKSLPSKHKYERTGKSRSPPCRSIQTRLPQGARTARSLYVTKEPKQIVAETPALAPSKFSQQLQSPSAMRHISFDEPRKPFDPVQQSRTCGTTTKGRQPEGAVERGSRYNPRIVRR